MLNTVTQGWDMAPGSQYRPLYGIALISARRALFTLPDVEKTVATSGSSSTIGCASWPLARQTGFGAPYDNRKHARD